MTSRSIISAAFITCFVTLSGCKKEDDPQPAEQPDVIVYDTIIAPTNSVFDASGNLYSTVVIGSQRWMRENLRASHFSNGDPIPYVPSATEWSAMSSAAWSYYDNDAAYGEIYGKLYNGYTVSDPRNACPAGWHVPTDEEWMELEIIMGVPESELTLTASRGPDANAGGKMKATVLWDLPNAGADNSSGFLGLPTGMKGPTGLFTSNGSKGHFWSSTTLELNESHAWSRQLWWNSHGIFRYAEHKRAGIAVRCVED